MFYCFLYYCYVTTADDDMLAAAMGLDIRRLIFGNTLIFRRSSSLYIT
jgi:hypothetical protein